MMRRAVLVFAAMTVVLLLATPSAGAQTTGDDHSPTGGNPTTGEPTSGGSSSGGSSSGGSSSGGSSSGGSSSGGSQGGSSAGTTSPPSGPTSGGVGGTTAGATEGVALEEPLARTGSNSTLPLVRFGFGLLAAGGVAILVSRRRKASVSADA